VVADGETGLLVDPTAVEEIASALERLLGNRDLAARLGARGRREVEERYTWDKVVGRIEAVYDNLLESSR
jgi:glycosyltransferase involved in cell wall biosynthesis